jgi:hypothetical protein
VWVFTLGARFTSFAQCQMRDYAARILACVRVLELVQEIKGWGHSWPVALAALRVLAKRPWLYPEVGQFKYIPFLVEQLMGEGLGGLEAFEDEGEWISVTESFELLRPYKQEASAMVDTLLDGLMELFDSL